MTKPDPTTGEPVSLVCADGTRLRADLWKPLEGSRGIVVVNSATGVAARYYHRYARYLVSHGFSVLTYDYRGIGLSRPASLRGARITLREWGEQDFEAALVFARDCEPDGKLVVVGHSIGGMLIGFAPSAPWIDRVLTVGSQYGYWPDYAARSRLALLARWHLVMPLVTAVFGYFPGRRLGWLVDLPPGIAYDWAGRRARFESSHADEAQTVIRARFAAVRAPILSLASSDDVFATEAALDRTLAYFSGSERHRVILRPEALGQETLGHFAMFHERCHAVFWPATVEWLRHGRNPWASVAKFLPASRP